MPEQPEQTEPCDLTHFEAQGLVLRIERPGAEFFSLRGGSPVSLGVDQEGCDH